MNKTKLLIPIIFIVVLGVFSLNAQISEKINLHGFGAWGYGNTDGAHYMTGEDDGDFDHANFYLNINANPFEKLSIIAQIGAVQDHQGINFEFDYAFAEWTFSDLFKFRIGKVKHAFGIFGEILNVGTLQPFMALPQGIYGSHGFVGKGLNGVALTGSFYTRQGWGIAYDVYYGQLKTISKIPSIIAFTFSRDPNTLHDGMESYNKDIVDLIGGRISFSTPIHGLNIGFSYYSGEDKATEGVGEGGYYGDQSSYGAHVEYLSTNLWIRSEYVHLIQNADTGQGQNLETLQDCFYVEAAYKLFDSWQVAVRYDWSEGNITELDMNLLPRFFKEYMKHRDISLGLNYWFGTNLVIKLSYHMVTGIQYAWPHFENPMAFMQGQFENKTKLIQFGVHYSF